jgi:membrane protein DedA with SNARE-associated domain
MRNLTLFVGMLVYSAGLLAQQPTHYPSGNDPIRWTPINIIVYIVIPVVLIVAWIIMRRRKTKKKSGGSKD